MEKNQAIKILLSLLSGFDPNTGRKYKLGDINKNEEIIQALKIAIEHLKPPDYEEKEKLELEEKENQKCSLKESVDNEYFMGEKLAKNRLEFIKKYNLPKNTFLAWSEKEKEELVEKFMEGYSIKELGKVFERTEKSIEKKLKAFRVIGEDFVEGELDWGINEKGAKLLIKLLRWRLKQSEEEGIFPLKVIEDDTLGRIAMEKPLSKRELENIEGFSEEKIENYGDEICCLLKDFSEEKRRANKKKIKVFEGIQAKTIFDLRKKEPLPKRTGKQWFVGEGKEIIFAFENGLTISEIAQKHERTEEAIKWFLERKGKL